MRKTEKKTRKGLRTFFLSLFLLCVFGAGAVIGINAWVINRVQDCIITQEQALTLQDVDCVVILGCQVQSDGSPCDMLEDRLKRGVALYTQGIVPKILVSGDHGTQGYDEVNAMKRYVLDAGIPSEDVFMDHAGFSTYESIYRAKEIFCAKKILVVTQEYHLYRALYIAQGLGIEAYGVAADYREYSGQLYRDVREALARVKDFGMTIFKPEPTYLGEIIPVSGNGEQTHDQNSWYN